MKKQLCKTFRKMAAKLKEETFKVNRYVISQGDEKLGILRGQKQAVGTQIISVNHYRRLKRIFTRDGVKGVELYYKKHAA